MDEPRIYTVEEAVGLDLDEVLLLNREYVNESLIDLISDYKLPRRFVKAEGIDVPDFLVGFLVSSTFRTWNAANGDGARWAINSKQSHSVTRLGLRLSIGIRADDVAPMTGGQEVAGSNPTSPTGEAIADTGAFSLWGVGSSRGLAYLRRTNGPDVVPDHPSRPCVVRRQSANRGA